MGSDPDDEKLFFINASKTYLDYRHISWFSCTIIRFHLACSIPPRTSHRPLLRTLTDEGPFPDIGSHVIQPVHPLFCCCNRRTHILIDTAIVAPVALGRVSGCTARGSHLTRRIIVEELLSGVQSTLTLALTLRHNEKA